MNPAAGDSSKRQRLAALLLDVERRDLDLVFKRRPQRFNDLEERQRGAVDRGGQNPARRVDPGPASGFPGVDLNRAVVLRGEELHLRPDRLHVRAGVDDPGIDTQAQAGILEDRGQIPAPDPVLAANRPLVLDPGRRDVHHIGRYAAVRFEPEHDVLLDGLGQGDVGHPSGLHSAPGLAGEGQVVRREGGSLINIGRLAGGHRRLVDNDVVALGHPAFLFIQLGRIEREVDGFPGPASGGRDHSAEGVRLGLDRLRQTNRAVRRGLAVDRELEFRDLRVQAHGVYAQRVSLDADLVDVKFLQRKIIVVGMRDVARRAREPHETEKDDGRHRAGGGPAQKMVHDCLLIVCLTSSRFFMVRRRSRALSIRIPAGLFRKRGRLRASGRLFRGAGS